MFSNDELHIMCKLEFRNWRVFFQLQKIYKGTWKILFLLILAKETVFFFNWLN